MEGEKTLTWIDIENNLRASLQNSPGETEAEKLAYFKKGILGHLEKLQEEEEKKIIHFPKNKPIENKR